MFRGVIVISYRDLIFEKKAGRLWLVAVGRATFHGKFSYPYFPQYLSYKLQSACITVSYILLVKSDHNYAHFDNNRKGKKLRRNIVRQADPFYRFAQIKLLVIANLCNGLRPVAALINCSNLR